MDTLIDSALKDTVAKCPGTNYTASGSNGNISPTNVFFAIEHVHNSDVVVGFLMLRITYFS
jgi:hypothetical protein